MHPATSDIRAVEPPQPRRRQPRAARPAEPDPGRRADRHGHGRWRIRHAPLPQGHHLPASDTEHPDPENGRLWKDDCPAARARNETLRATRQYGWAFWKRWTGYHARNRIEAKIRCLKAFGERIAARDPDRQTAEIHIRIALMNRFNALGTAEIARVA